MRKRDGLGPSRAIEFQKEKIDARVPKKRCLLNQSHNGMKKAIHCHFLSVFYLQRIVIYCFICFEP